MGPVQKFVCLNALHDVGPTKFFLGSHQGQMARRCCSRSTKGVQRTFSSVGSLEEWEDDRVKFFTSRLGIQLDATTVAEAAATSGAAR